MSTETEPLTPWQLARLAECFDPDSVDSPGARFLAGVRDDVNDRLGGLNDDPSDVAAEIADSAVPVYTHERWRVFVDLGAWEEDPSDLTADTSDMTQAAAICLYMIAERLAAALIAAADEGDDEA